MARSSPRTQPKDKQPTPRPVPAAGAVAAEGGGMLRGLRRAFSSLHNADFRLLWTGALMSSVGSQMQAVAAQFLVFQLTHSPLWLGFDAFATWVPMNLFLPLGGVLADRADRRRIVIICNALLALIAAVLATLSLLDYLHVMQLHVLHIVIASAFSGAISGLVTPAFMALLPEIVGREDLPNAVALNSMQYNISRALGPAAGAIGMAIGVTWCFGLNATSFIAPIYAAAHLKWRPKPATEPHHHPLKALMGGFNYLRSRHDLLLIETIVVIMSCMISPFFAMLAAFSEGYGFGKYTAGPAFALLVSMFGVGAVCGSAFNASHKQGAPSPWVAFPLLCVLGSMQLLISLQPPFAVAVMLTAVCGLCFMISGNRLFATVLSSTPDAFRGRISSLHFLSFGIGLPVGSLTAGVIAKHYSMLGVFRVFGLCLISAMVFLFFVMKHRKVEIRSQGHLDPGEIEQAAVEAVV